MYIYIYIYTHMYDGNRSIFQLANSAPPPSVTDSDLSPAGCGQGYTRSPLQYSRLFGPSPWKILALIV